MHNCVSLANLCVFLNAEIINRNGTGSHAANRVRAIQPSECSTLVFVFLQCFVCVFVSLCSTVNVLSYQKLFYLHVNACK